MTSPRLLTEALFWTESHYDQEEARWFGRVKGLAAKPNALKTPRTLCDNLRKPSGLAVDSEARSVYWTDWGEGVISRCNVDSGSVSRFGEALTSSRQPFGLAVDPNTDTVMWSSAAQPGIRRADLSGANVRSASEGDRNSWSCKGPWGIALQLRPGCASARGSGTGDRYHLRNMGSAASSGRAGGASSAASSQTGRCATLCEGWWTRRAWRSTSTTQEGASSGQMRRPARCSALRSTVPACATWPRVLRSPSALRSARLTSSGQIGGVAQSSRAASALGLSATCSPMRYHPKASPSSTCGLPPKPRG